MFAFLRATQKLGLKAGPEARLSVRMLSRSTPAGTEAMPLPTHDKVARFPLLEKAATITVSCVQVYPQKIVTIVDQISGLNLLEVADLNSLLKSRLNISDAPVMMAGGPVAAPKVEEEEEAVAAPTAIQTSFTVKLEKFDAAKKVAIIKEIKSIVEGMNLVQAKKFVESAPAVVKADISKEEADKIKESLSALGGECTIE